MLCCVVSCRVRPLSGLKAGLQVRFSARTSNSISSKLFETKFKDGCKGSQLPPMSVATLYKIPITEYSAACCQPLCCRIRPSMHVQCSGFSIIATYSCFGYFPEQFWKVCSFTGQKSIHKGVVRNTLAAVTLAFCPVYGRDYVMFSFYKKLKPLSSNITM